DGITALRVASGRGHTEVVRILLSSGANPNICDKSRITPLMVSSQICNIEIVQVLLSAGANVNAIDNQGRTALMFALHRTPIRTVLIFNEEICTTHDTLFKPENRYIDVVRALLRSGANVNAVDRDG